MADSESSILQGTLDLMVLKTLEHLGPLHGYGIARRIEQVGERALIVNQAKFYTLTKSGQRQLQAETANWERIAGVMGRMLHPETGS
jgi:PadR family transcriptional regulator PadR